MNLMFRGWLNKVQHKFRHWRNLLHYRTTIKDRRYTSERSSGAESEDRLCPFQTTSSGSSEETFDASEGRSYITHQVWRLKFTR